MGKKSPIIFRKRMVVAITGASGCIYGVRLVQELLKLNYEVHLIISDPGFQVLKYEMKIETQATLVKQLCEPDFKTQLILHECRNIAAPIASGSFQTEGMIVSPCSMGTLAAISQGTSQNLVTRSADVCLKERRPLILVVRETPLHAIHLENMLKLSKMGVTILPAMPAFYQHPQSIGDLIDFMTGRTLDCLKIEHHLFQRYGEGNEFQKKTVKELFKFT